MSGCASRLKLTNNIICSEISTDDEEQPLWHGRILQKLEAVVWRDENFTKLRLQLVDSDQCFYFWKW